MLPGAKLSNTVGSIAPSHMASAVARAYGQGLGLCPWCGPGAKSLGAKLKAILKL